MQMKVLITGMRGVGVEVGPGLLFLRRRIGGWFGVTLDISRNKYKLSYATIHPSNIQEENPSA